MSQTLLLTKTDSLFTKNDPFEWCRGTCLTARKGERCKNFPSPGRRYCWRHFDQQPTTPPSMIKFLARMLDQYRWDNCFICTCCGQHRNNKCKDDCEVNNVIIIEADRQGIKSQ